MKSLKIISWVAMDGKTKVEAKIEIERSVNEKIAYADGYNIPVGKETYKSIDIRVFVNDKQMERSGMNPQISNHPKVLETGRYAVIGKVAIMKNIYEEIMTVINTETVILESDEEYAALKTIEDEKVAKAESRDIEAAKNYAKQIKNGLCPRCGSYCYGDCTAN